LLVAEEREREREREKRREEKRRDRQVNHSGICIQ